MKKKRSRRRSIKKKKKKVEKTIYYLKPEDCADDEILIMPLYIEDTGYCKEKEHYDV